MSRVATASRITAAALFFTGIALRAWLLASPYGGLNADEAVTGVIGSGAAHGRFPIVFGGSVYGGTIDGYVAAPLLRIWPGNYLVLKIVTVLLWLAVAAAVGLLLRPLFGSGPALVAAGYVWMFSWSMMVLSITAYTGYASGLLLTVLAAIAVQKGLGAEHRSRMHVAAGVASGLALWCHPLYVVTLLPLLLGATWVHRSELRQWVLTVGMGTLIGLSPFLFWNARHGWASRKQPPALVDTTYTRRIHNIFFELGPRAFGLRTFTGRWILGRVGIVLWWLVLAAGLFGFYLLLRRSAFGFVLGVSGLAGIPLLAVFNALSWFRDGRYFAMILLPWVCGLIATADAIARRVRRPAAVPVLIGLTACVGCLPWFRSEVPRRFLNPERSTQDIAARLRTAHVRGVKGEYWIVNRITFATDEHIAGAVTAGPERFASLAGRVATLPPGAVAYVYYTGQERIGELPDDMKFQKVIVAEATLFLPTSSPER